MTLASKLTKFETKVVDGDTVLLVTGSQTYYKCFRDAFPDFHFGPLWADEDNKFDWGVQIDSITPQQRSLVDALAQKFTKVVMLEDALMQSFALDFYSTKGGRRTSVGSLVYKCKHRKQHRLFPKLLSLYCEFVESHPSYRRADMVIAAPPSEPKPFDIPELVVEELCQRFGYENGSEYLEKVKKTPQMKNLHTREEKLKNIKGSFKVTDKDAIAGKRIILIDDVYEAGVTLNELANEIEDYGIQLLGLVATKTHRDST